MKHRLSAVLIGGIAAIMFGQIASAADLPVKAPVYKAPPPPPVLSWTGCYIGAHGGAAWGNNATMGWQDVNNGGNIYDPISFGSRSETGGVVGGQLGCNYQFPGSVWLVGIEGDASWTSLTNDNTGGPFTANGADIYGGGSVAMTEKTDFLGSIRGRLG